MSTPHQPVHVAMMNLLWPRAGLELSLFYDYWSGAHTQISSRLPGIHQYFQHHLDPAAGRSFPGADRLMARNPAHPGFYGDAEITFTTAAELQAFADSLAPLMQDEQNVFARTISYQATGENVGTPVDRCYDDSPNGDLGTAEKYMLYLRQADDLGVVQFRRRIVEDVVPLIAGHEDIVKVRYRLVDRYDNDAVTLLAPNVSNVEEERSQFQGCLEVVFSDPMARRRYGTSTECAQSTEVMLESTRGISVLRALRTFTVYNHGRITTAGLRTPQMAAQIAAIGAINQLDPSVRGLILRAHTQLTCENERV